MTRRRSSARRPAISVLRIGHRPGRDPRLTTHLALAARAWGAERMYLHPPDPILAERLAHVAREWGAGFTVEPAPDWKAVVRAHAGAVVHLTMYGEPIDRRLPELARQRRLLLVVGGAKVPPELFQRADWNVAVGAQPHSEVAAVAVLLDRLGGIPPARRRKGARRRIVPQPRGKRVLGPGGRKRGRDR
ncbi:MAG: tRNA (cytidine(56)-2'-O)-methyltransferase [Thermoplasmata archaeon]|nr:tRNA (cytidine(56)-2'-O)-methyltransferase [Thermoplasmata archaeon]